MVVLYDIVYMYIILTMVFYGKCWVYHVIC